MGVVDEVKDRLDVTDFIGRHVHLKKSGRSFKGLCPFHHEKTPSFYVFPETQTWHCFGCGRGGDIFNFVMEYEGLDFRAALEELARQAGVEIKPQTPEQRQAETEAERLLSVLEAATEYFHQLLLSAPQAETARAYLQKRGFTKETIQTFRLGYSLRSWDALRSHLTAQGFSIPDLLKVGLLVEKERGGTYDRFRDRLMIPICDRRGRVIAFGGRVLNPEDSPKYINSPKTPLFDKSSVLFGYHLAGRAIREQDAVVIVEGYMDVMIPHQAGFRNVVAPMGTALTEAHLRQLQRLTKKFILAMDPDAAGIHAVLQGLEVSRQTLEREWTPVFDPRGLIGYEDRLGAEIRAVTLPGGLDPDEIILRDPQQWADLIEHSQPIVWFYFEQLLQQIDPHEPKGKARIVDAMIPLLADIADNVEREGYVQDIALKLGLDVRTLAGRLRTRERAAAVRRQAAARAPDRSRSVEDIEAYALTVLMHFPELLAIVNDALQAESQPPVHSEDFSGVYRHIWDAWLELTEHPELELRDLLPDEVVQKVAGWLTTPLPDRSQDLWARDVTFTILRMRKRRLSEHISHVTTLITENQAAGDLTGGQYALAMTDLTRSLSQVQLALSHIGQGLQLTLAGGERS